MQKDLPLPPYGKIIKAYSDSKVDFHTGLRIFVGKNAKEIAQNEIRRFCMPCTYLPYGDSYEKYHWPIEGQEIILRDFGLVSVNFLKKMCIYLLQNHSPRQIALFSSSIMQNPDDYIVYLPSNPQGVSIYGQI